MLFITLLAIALTLLIFWIKWIYSYWKRQGFPYVEPKIPCGVLDSVTKGKNSFGLAIYDVYKSTCEKVIGIYIFTRPALLVCDADLAHQIQTRDFASFHDRGIYVDEKNDPMSATLFGLEGKNWKTMRNTLTPAFTTGRLKAMFSTADEIGDKLLEHLNSIIPENGSVELEMKAPTATYAIDIIASVIFGLDINSYKNPNNELQKVNHLISEHSLSNLIRGTCQFLYPELERIFVAIGWKQEAVEIMSKLVKRTIDYREKHNIMRKDMLQMLLQLRNQGEINANDEDWSAKMGDLKHLSSDMIAAQLFIFLVAGYETTASTISFTLYELAQNEELLKKAEEDVKNALDKHGELNYDALQDMKFIDLCIMESIRKYPGLPILNRICTKDYQMPDSDKVIKKGTPIIISLLGLHRDPEHFPDPLKYDPERFLEENRNYNPVAYMPFGEGPHNCIGLRMGRINVKIALTKILCNFNIEVRKEKKEIEFSKHGVVLLAKDGINVRLSKKKNST